MTLVFAIAYKRLLVDDRHPKLRSRSVLADKVLDRLRSDVEIVIDDSDSRIPPGVKAALEALKSEQRDVLSLRIVAGLSVEQTASVIGSTVDSVKAVQRKGLAKLRNLMSTPVVLT